MRIYNFIIALIICFCVSLQAQNNADNFKQQAQSSFENKDYTKARYLYIQAYKDYANEGKITQAIECGTQAASLYYRENYYQEAFDLCRQMSQIVANPGTNRAKETVRPAFYDNKRAPANVYQAEERRTGTAPA